MNALTAQDFAAAARRGALSLASDPAVRFYSLDAVGAVYEATIRNLAGAGSIAAAGAAIADDPAVSDIPDDVVEAVMAASVKHFARALKDHG